MAKRVKCEKCEKSFYVERVKRSFGKIHCNSCFQAHLEERIAIYNDSPELLAYVMSKYSGKNYNKYLTEIDFTPPDIFKDVAVRAAHQNDSKLESRELIVKTVNAVFGAEKPIRFVEFLGAGHGALYYAKNLNISRMLLVEKDKKDFNNFYGTSYREFCKTTYPMALDLLNVDLLDHLRIANPFHWNVINLDFCSYCYEFNNSGDSSSLALIEEFFRTKSVERNHSLLITSFMISGYSLRIAKIDNKKIYTDEDEITTAIIGLAVKHGFTLQKVLSNKYDSNSRTSMINLGFIVR